MMKHLRMLKWMFFDRRIIDEGIEYERLSFSDALMCCYPKIWRIGVRRLECGCAYRIGRKSEKVLVCLRHVMERFPIDED